MLSRMEHDSIGALNVPAEAYYGVQSMRAATNFQITHRLLHPVLIDSIVMVKKAAAITNEKSGKLDQQIAQTIIQACDEILDGNLRDQFIVDAIQGGAGTSANMNANEVIANRAIEILGGTKGDYSIVHPNDHVNMSQSTNDVIQTAGKINPVILEVVSQVAYLIIGHDYTITMAAEAGQCEEYIEKSVGISTALCPYIGYAKSAEIAKKSLKTGISVKELILEEGLLKEEELKEILKPEKMTQPMREKVMKAVS